MRVEGKESCKYGWVWCGMLERRRGKFDRVVGKIAECIFIASWVSGDWMSACIIPLYKDKRDRHECESVEGICSLSVVGKLYGRVLRESERVRRV